MKELLRDVNKAMKAELRRANDKFPLFRSDHEGLGVLTEEIFEADQDGDMTRKLFAQLSSCVFSDDHDVACRRAKRLRERALYTACEYIQVAAMAEKFNLKAEKKNDELEQEYIDYLARTCPEAEEDVEIIAPSFLKDNPDVIKACKELAAVLESVEKENKDAE